MPIINDEAVFHKIGENNGGKILFDEFAGWEREEQKFVPKEFVQIVTFKFISTIDRIKRSNFFSNFTQ